MQIRHVGVAWAPLLLGLLLLASGAQAQQAQTAPERTVVEVASPVTGDRWLDAQLADITLYAQRYPESFLEELVRYAGISYEYASSLLKEHGWQGGDLYLACFLGKALETGCRPLVRAKAQQPGVDWEELLQQLPVLPERLHWRAVRHAVVDSYAHWDRPITLDATLRGQMAQKRAVQSREVPARPRPQAD